MIEIRICPECGKAFYKPEEAWKNVGAAPLHPGAEKWYKEKGYMK